MTPSQVNRGN